MSEVVQSMVPFAFAIREEGVLTSDVVIFEAIFRRKGLVC
jgi:hypothetical protein